MQILAFKSTNEYSAEKLLNIYVNDYQFNNNKAINIINEYDYEKNKIMKTKNKYLRKLKLFLFDWYLL